MVRTMRGIGWVLMVLSVWAAIPVYAAPTVVSRSPGQGVANADPFADLELTFSEEIEFGSGEVRVYQADGTLIETVDVPGTQVTVNVATAKIDLDNTLAQGVGYYVEIDAGTFSSASGDFAGFSGTGDWSFSTSSYSVQAVKLTPPASVDEYRFGWAVAQDGDWLVIGSYGEQIDGLDNVGATWVYKRDGGDWRPHQKLLAPDGGVLDEFGWAVDIDGTTLAVGAWDDGGDPGRVYVYVLTGNTWTLQQQPIIPAQSNAGDSFGHEVLLDGDTLFVGAPTDGTFDYGAAYVFTRSGDTWTQSQRLTPTGASGFFPYGFGFALARDGNNLLIGAPFESLGRGAVYPYTLSGTWNAAAKLTASDGQSGTISGPFLGDFFGADISIDGTEAVITAWQDETASPSEGSAYIFTFGGASWSEGEKLLPDEDDHDGFGYRAEIVGDTILIGADVDGITENPATGDPLPGGSGDESGVVYQFVRDTTDADNNPATGWLIYDRLEPTDNEADDFYGNQFVFDGTTAYIGAWGDDDAGTNIGAVYEQTISATPTLELALTNTDTDTDVRTLATADTIDLATAPTNWGFTANLTPDSVVEVTFTLTGDAAQSGTATTAPYTFPTDGSPLNLPAGNYSLEVQPVPFGGASVATTYTLTVLSGDTTPPQVVTTDPTANTFNVATDAGITVNFNEAVNLASGFATVDCPSYASPQTITTTATGVTQTTITPNAYAEREACTVTLVASNITDLFGNPLDGDADGTGGDDFSFEFTTVNEGIIVGDFVKFLSSKPASGLFAAGNSVALDGDLLAVGIDRQNSAEGAVAVFERDGGVWRQTGRLLPSASSIDARLGYAVAVDAANNRVVAGAAFHDETGRVFVYEKSGDTWEMVSDFVAADSVSTDNFGSSLALEGDNLIVGAPGLAPGQPGKAYHFQRQGNGDWVDQNSFNYTSIAGDEFGTAVALEGNLAAVTAMTQGVLLFDLAGGTSPVATLDINGSVSGDFGRAVDINGTQIIVGAPTTNGATGAAYIYEQGADLSAWSGPVMLVASDAAVGDAFGDSVALGDGFALVGAPGANSIYQFIDRKNDVWVYDVTISPTLTDDAFGSALALDGLQVLGGAPQDDTQADNAGAAYLTTVTFTPPNPADVNGDGVISPADVVFVLNRLGDSGGDADVDGNGTVEQADVNIIVGQLGTVD